MKGSTAPPKRRLRTAIRICALLALLPLLGVAAIELHLALATRRAIYRDLGAVPTRRVAIVFGAQVLPGDRLSVALANRVEAGIALYRAGKVETLLMTGDGREANYNEPEAMRDYALERGVPSEAILIDRAGLRTYDSCYRARSVFGIDADQAIVVTQEYHLPRAIFTCGRMGVSVIGYVAAPFVGPKAREGALREHPARWLAWWQVMITRPTPPTLR